MKRSASGAPPTSHYYRSGAVNTVALGNPPLTPKPAPDVRGANDTSIFLATAGGAVDEWAAVLARLTAASREAAFIAFPVESNAGLVSMRVESEGDSGNGVNTYLVVTTPISPGHDPLGGEKVFYSEVRQRLGTDYPAQIAVVLQYAQDGV